MNLTAYRSVSGGFWGAVALVIVWGLHALAKIDVPVEIGMAIGIIVQGLGTHFKGDQPEV